MRSVTAQHQSLLASSESQSSVILALRDGTVKRLSTSHLFDAEGSEYLPHLRSVGALTQTTDEETDRVRVSIQNVDCAAGLDVVSSSRQFERALCSVGRVYKSITNPAITEWRTLFPAMVVGIEANETEVVMDTIADYEGVGQVVADRTETDYCDALFKGIECGYTGNLETCNHQLKSVHGCAGRLNIHRNQSFKFPEQPVSAPPVDDGGGGGGGYLPPCFLGDISVWTPRGDIPFWDLEKELKKSRAVYSFDPLTGERYTDEIEYLMTHDALGYSDFHLDHTILKVTPEHPVWVGFKTFKPAFQFREADRLKVMLTDKMTDSRLNKLVWHWGEKITVYNIKVKHFETYFANRVPVHNRKQDPIF